MKIEGAFTFFQSKILPFFQGKYFVFSKQVLETDPDLYTGNNRQGKSLQAFGYGKGDFHDVRVHCQSKTEEVIYYEIPVCA